MNKSVIKFLTLLSASILIISGCSRNSEDHPRIYVYDNAKADFLTSANSVEWKKQLIEGKDEEVIVKLPHKPGEVVECDHLERSIEARTALDLDQDQFMFKIHHDQIRTFLVRF